ncbi:hypothetical protein MTQ12_14880, partial [Brevibacterium sp. R8603A2]|nr:hypothetical protein [Brevibacterium sp. R8603A2]
ALVAGRSGPSSREEQLEAEVAELTQALGEAHLEARVWKKSAECQIPGLVEAERLFCIQAALPMVWFSAKCVASISAGVW